MDNQHRQIKGYRELSAEEIALIHRIKEQGVALEGLVDYLRGTAADKRWLAIGATDLQTGLMALTRSIAQPTFF